MKIRRLQQDPPVFEVKDFEPKKDCNELIRWLFNPQPGDMSLDFNGSLLRFRTHLERHQFAIGFRIASDLFLTGE